ncbi:hypothetical protein Vafri_9855, partial [Volvox africanus]
MACSSLDVLSPHQECGEDTAMLPVGVQAADASSNGVGSGRPAFPPPAPNPRSQPSRSSSTGHQLPSWINAWAKPKISSSQLTDGVHLREFKARPLPSSCARRRTGLSSSASGDAATAAAAGAMRAATGPRATSTGRVASLPSDGSDIVASTAAGVSSVLMHFIRASSGPCGVMAGPPASTAQPRPFRTLRTSYTGSSGGGGAAGGSAGAAALAGSCAGARAGNGTGRCLGAASFNKNSGCGNVVSSGVPRWRPMSAGPRQQPVSGTEGPVGPTSLDAESASPLNEAPLAASYNGLGMKQGDLSKRPASASASRGCCISGQSGSLAAAGSLRNRPASANGVGGARTASTGSAAAAAVAVFAQCGGGRDVSAPRHRGPAAAVERMGLGPLEEDVGYEVAASDMLLAAGGDGSGARGRGPCEGGGGAAPMPLQHIPPTQHMLLSGSLQDLCERLARPGDRHLHLSLGSVSFSGDLDPSTGNMIQIQNRTVILHNCTLAFKPGQKLYVGPGGHVILADIIVLGLAGAAAAAEGNGNGGGGGKAAPTPNGAGRPPPPPHHHGNGTYTPRSRGSGGRRGAGNTGLPLLHATDGGRLLLRGCCVKTVSAAAVGSGGNSSGDGSAVPVSPTDLLTPIRQRQASTSAAVAATVFTGGGSSGSSCGSATPQIQHLSILADGGAAVEAIGCRLGSCAAVGGGTWLALRRCRVKPSSADLAVAAAAAAAAAPLTPPPLLRAVDGCAVEVSHSELCDGPMQGIDAAGATTRVTLSRSAVSGCRSHGARVCHAAALMAAACRLSGNGATGLTVRGRGTLAELRDCELSGNAASNIWIGGGSAMNLVSCAALGSRDGCGVALEGAGARLLAAACAFDGNTSCGVRVRQDAVVELRDCSSSGNSGSGLEVEGTVDSEDNAELLAEATLACTAPPPPPLPEVFCLVSGGQLAKNGAHGCVVRRGGGLRVTAGCELSQNGADGACADGVGCELLLDGCAVLGNGESGFFVCSGAAVWADSCRLGGNMHGDVAVGGRGSRGRLVACAFDFNPMTALRVHLGAKVALRRCTMEPRPSAAPPTSRASHRLRQLRSASSQRQGGGGGGGSGCGGSGSGGNAAARAWTVDLVRSQSVQLRGRGSVLSVDGRAFFPLGEVEEEVEEEVHAAVATEAERAVPQTGRDLIGW